MNVYDFDETIYSGDSTRDFYFYCIRKDVTLLRFLPKQGYYFLKYMFGVINKTAFKEKFYMFLGGIKNIDSEIELFWKKNIRKIKPWYYEQKMEDDIIISASPEFLLKPVADKLGFTLIASRVDKTCGKTEGENCYGEEKVKRLSEFMPKAEIEKFYSDSLSDSPLANISKEAFIVQKNELICWNEYKPSGYKKILRQFMAKDFLAFMCVGVVNTFNGVLFETLFSLIIKNLNVSFICGYILSLIIAYFLNCKFVFKCKSAFGSFGRFVLSYVPNFLIQNICVIIFGNILQFPNLLVYILAAMIGIPVTFLLLKLFAFKNKKNI